jgi:hypothetical protein
MYLYFSVGPIPEGLAEMEVTVTLTQGENTLGTSHPHHPVTLQEMVLNEDSATSPTPTPPTTTPSSATPGPEIHSVYAEETADGYNILFATARGVYQFTPRRGEGYDTLRLRRTEGL